MEIIKENQRITLQPLSHVTIHEYETHDREISSGVAVIKGRYPEQGFVINQKCKELVYVLEGSGTLITTDKETAFTKGDVLFIENKEKFAWNGNMVLFMATTPTFDPAQHVEAA
ncbi:MAG: hypothetical protein WC612_04625 [Bdellovibrionales bacterium]